MTMVEGSVQPSHTFHEYRKNSCCV